MHQLDLLLGGLKRIPRRDRIDRHKNRPKLRPDIPDAQPIDVGMQTRLRLRYIQLVKTPGRLGPDLPRQIVVPIEHITPTMDVRSPPRNLVAVLAPTLSLSHLSFYHLSFSHLP